MRTAAEPKKLTAPVSTYIPITTVGDLLRRSRIQYKVRMVVCCSDVTANVAKALSC